MGSQDFDPSEVILGIGVPADGWSGSGRFGKLHFYWRILLTEEEEEGFQQQSDGQVSSVGHQLPSVQH